MRDWNRRGVIGLVGGAAAWPFAARAQPHALPVIGLLSSRSPVTDAPFIAAVRRGLSELGFAEGHHFETNYRWADGQYDRLPGLAADLVRRRVAVIVTMGGESSALAAKLATTTIPIVFISGDPVKSGLVTNLHRPEGNITGASVFLDDVGPKRLELVRELRPNVALIGMLVNPSNPTSETQAAELQLAARRLGQNVEILNASSNREIETAFVRLAQMRADALLVAVDPHFHTRAVQFVVLAARHAIPTAYFRREFVVAGGLMSYGSNADEAYHVLGIYAARILKGEKPSDLPIQRPTKFELVINLGTARALGLDMPPTLLARADEVIE